MSYGEKAAGARDDNRLMRWNLSAVLASLGRSATSHGQVPIRVTNVTRHTELGDRIEVAGNGQSRRKGLLGREGLASGEGLWIVPCEAVHTFWMRFPIDLVYIDRKRRIVKTRNSVPAWRLSAALTAHSVLELPAGTIRETHSARGDTLEFEYPGSSDGESEPQHAGE